ncbi:ABC transporter substrate-binding protein [Terrabacter sp. MAHUQ-38]|uniref:ABC transporter substrate-binding protein n=1 Tax=unclassified Terrabacter TaxID=2630222 RepID=UPI00165E8E2E|nr:sugar ABC transporter substrate-binding protein [Terrabacter sp. MAHUQ-38]MBC9822809.1 sugar ABC transporter substrate-binding protein [Terrabacter sp. MAHUQ-38]
MNKAPKAALTLAAAAVSTSLVLSGCSSAAGTTGGGGAAAAPLGQDAITKALNTPTTLTFWTWVPDIDKQVKLFQAKYPKIKVKVENVGQGLEHYQKVRTAVKSGQGAPDVVQIEYQFISSFTLTKSLLDLAPYGADDLEGDYVPWVWNQVKQNGGIYAIPQDTGPLGNLYRTDIMKKAGIATPPATYDEYAAAAQKVKDATGSYISNLPSNDPAQVTGLLWQAGIKPFSYDGNRTVGINANSPEVKKVLAYWQGLIQKGLVSTDGDFTDQWYQGFASGKYAGWLTAAWGPIFLQGTAKGTAGKWSAAPLPQWARGQNASGNWGGSSDAVLASSKNPIAAYELAKWINNDKSSTTKFANEQFLFPAAKNVLEDPAFTGGKSSFFGGQQVNKQFAEISGTVDTKFEWLPFMDYAYSAFNDTVGKAIGDKGDLSAASDAWQTKLVSYAKAQGFTVK